MVGDDIQDDVIGEKMLNMKVFVNMLIQELKKLVCREVWLRLESIERVMRTSVVRGDLIMCLII